jgi:putative endonuclease
MFYYTYILKNKKDGKMYTGSTNNLRKRLLQHSKGLSTYTKKVGPFDLIYYEACLSEEKSRSREKYLKSGMGKRYLKNRLGASYL